MKKILLTVFILFLTVGYGFAKDMNLEELSKYNGKDGNPAYVAIDGVIYDVTKSKYWKNGEHMNRATAGNDLSEVIKQAPHSKDKLKKFPVIGNLVK